MKSQRVVALALVLGSTPFAARAAVTNVSTLIKTVTDRGYPSYVKR